MHYANVPHIQIANIDQTILKSDRYGRSIISGRIRCMHVTMFNVIWSRGIYIKMYHVLSTTFDFEEIS